jgi:hypothetical protein
MGTSITLLPALPEIDLRIIKPRNSGDSTVSSC